MRQIKISDLITKSIEHTKIILFRPFSLKKWLCLLFIAFLAGALSGGCNSGGGSSEDEKKAEAATEESTITDENLQDLINRYESSDRPDISLKQEPSQGHSIASPAIPLCPMPKEEFGAQAGAFFRSKTFIVIVVFAGLVILALIVFMTWLTSRFKFIWYQSIVTNDASIKAPFHQYKKEGNSLFKTFMLITVIFFLFLGLWGWGTFASAKGAGVFENEVAWSFGLAAKAFALPLVTFLITVLGFTVFYIAIDHFVVPIMALDQSSFLTAAKKFTPILRNNVKDFLLYLLLLMGLGIVTSILCFIVILILLIGLFVTGGVIFGLLYLLFVALLKAKTLLIIVSVIIGIPFVAVAILLLISANLPFAVFFRSFSLYFLASLNCGYAPLPLETINPQPPANQP